MAGRPLAFLRIGCGRSLSIIRNQICTSSLRNSRRSCSTSCISMVCIPNCRAVSRFRVAIVDEAAILRRFLGQFQSQPVNAFLRFRKSHKT